MAEPLQIHTIVSMPFQENTYVVWRAGSSLALVIDGVADNASRRIRPSHLPTPVPGRHLPDRK